MQQLYFHSQTSTETGEAASSPANSQTLMNLFYFRKLSQLLKVSPGFTCFHLLFLLLNFSWLLPSTTSLSSVLSCLWRQASSSSAFLFSRATRWSKTVIAWENSCTYVDIFGKSCFEFRWWITLFQKEVKLLKMQTGASWRSPRSPTNKTDEALTPPPQPSCLVSVSSFMSSSSPSVPSDFLFLHALRELVKPARSQRSAEPHVSVHLIKS